ncbi:CPXCG motif-containing cysteine-rich protein [Shewanella sp. D64]|uniref:CPXCG motif-containing cysteine-rich protein n=1 Tax=unclassified Shewanella TaxID=196818 RepID=UPI0022BA472B|nr:MULTISPECIES: CPXCG motif-containing cysteine-rich protein [unclassified Shewanella]MEC4723939.1 CPXCG motif-containing cysteine-rich protein [Shewanella sp. D64]MEC4735959.1 CPXCG motif-containing cysteine-rich protein [Shewanella sp. E94]WBJ93075.1 CPXCG motif-containing cysteine-rich protein [Shewanella sp. MTB7]
MKYSTQTICCPHCGHHQHIDIDGTSGDQDYYDDCRICCNAIHLRIHLDESQQVIELYINSDN